MTANLLKLSEHAETQRAKLSAMPQSPKVKSQLTAWTNLWNYLNDPARPECKLTQTQKDFLTTELFMIDYNLALVLQPKPVVEDLKIEILPMDANDAYAQVFANNDKQKSERTTSTDVSEMNDMLEKVTTILNKYKNDPKQEYVVAFCNDTLDRIKKYGKNTRFTEKQIAFINKFYNSNDKEIGKSVATIVKHQPQQSHQSVDSVYSKWFKVVQIMYPVIVAFTPQGHNAESAFNIDKQFKINVVSKHTALPDYNRFNDYTTVQLQWLMKLMVINVILNLELNNKKIPLINNILDQLYERKLNPADIKLTDEAKAHANLFLDQYKQHPMMLKLKEEIDRQANLDYLMLATRN